MRSFLTYGLISLASVAALYACGDDSGDDGGNAGSGGSTAGQGGSGGATGGSAGATSGGNGGSGGATGGSGGNTNQVAANCTGCVELDLPFSAANQSALYQFTYPPPGLDFSNAVVTFAVQLLDGENPNLYAKIQVQNGDALDYAGFYNAPMTALTRANFPANTFVNISVDLSTLPGVAGGDAGVGDAGAVQGDAGDAGVTPPPTGVFDKSRVEAVQLQIGSTAAFTGSQFTTVEVDSVTITNVTGTTGSQFATGADGFALNNYPDSPTPPGTPPVVFH